MISTVTTTVTTIATLSFGAALGSLATVFLILLLASKEVLTGDSRAPLRLLGRTMDIGILPLLISFALIVAFKVLEVL